MSVEAQTIEKIDLTSGPVMAKKAEEPYYSEKTKSVLRKRFDDIDAGKVVYQV